MNSRNGHRDSSIGTSPESTNRRNPLVDIKARALERYQNLQTHIYSEVLNAVEGNEGVQDEGVGDLEDDHELEQLLNMVRIPPFLEKFMLWTLLACSDCFLHYFTIMPLRVISGFISKYRKGKNRKSLDAYNDRCKVCLILIAAVILNSLDTSKAYHRIKRQSSVKLYMLFSVLEMANKMLSSMGQSLFAVLFSRKNYQRILSKRLLMQALCLIYLIFHGYVMVYQIVALNVAVNSYSNALLTLLLPMQFAEIKASLFKKIDKEGLFQISIADVVERYQLVLLLLVIAIRNMIAKSKSQSNIIPNSWSLHSTSSVIAGILCGPMFNVIGSELIIDWVKHAYITKFNRIRPQIYDKFLLIVCKDHSTSLLTFRDRLGLPIPAFVVSFVVMLRPSLTQALNFSSPLRFLMSIFALVIGFAILVVFKTVLHVLLIKWGQVILGAKQLNTKVTENEYVPGFLSDGLGKVDKNSRSIIHVREPNVDENVYNGKNVCSSRLPNDIPPGPNDLRQRKNRKDPHSLENVARYKMISKQIW